VRDLLLPLLNSIPQESKAQYRKLGIFLTREIQSQNEFRRLFTGGNEDLMTKTSGSENEVPDDKHGFRK
jgi:hypothetical protein